MYESKMVCCLKANGKVLREHKDTVYVPFGTEYSVLLKNLNSVRALVTVEIDGVDVSEGNQLVVGANSEFELTRFIKNGNLKTGNRFKFIERTAGVENHRGVGMEDGIIRIVFQFERRIPAYIPPHRTLLSEKLYYTDPHWYGLVGGTTTDARGQQYLKGASSSTLRSAPASYSVAGQYEPVSLCNASLTSSVTAQSVTPALNEAGITVPGSKSDQQFQSVKDFPVEAETFVMVLKLLGETNTGELVTAPVTVKTKPKCVTCGRVNKSGAKFCTDCGTALSII